MSGYNVHVVPPGEARPRSRGFTFRRLAMLAAALAMSLLAGFPAVTAVVWGGTLLLALALNPRAAAWTVLGMAWAAALSAVQLLPTLATSEAWYPGWRASIDGRPAPLLVTNAAFRGLALPPGRHGAVISLLALALLTAGFVGQALGLRRPLRPPATAR